MDWWVDFVYFTNLPFSMVYLYNDNVIHVIQCSFYVDSNTDQYLFLVSGAPTFVSRHHLLFHTGISCTIKSEAFFAIDRLYRSPESFLGFATTFYSVQASKGRRPNSV